MLDKELGRATPRFYIPLPDLFLSKKQQTPGRTKIAHDLPKMAILARDKSTPPERTPSGGLAIKPFEMNEIRFAR